MKFKSIKELEANGDWYEISERDRGRILQSQDFIEVIDEFIKLDYNSFTLRELKAIINGK